MSFHDVKRQSPKAPKPREVIVRFRVTEEEYAAIEEAAEFDGARFEAELLERGLPKSAVETLKRPSEWMRYIVMKAATPTAEEARRKRAQEEERRVREAEQSRVRIARDAERSLERFITDAHSALSPTALFGSALDQPLEWAGAGLAALKQLEALKEGGALAAIKRFEDSGARAAIKQIEDSGAMDAIKQITESGVLGTLKRR